MKKTGRVWKILTPILAVLMIVSIVAIPVTASFDNAINVALGAKTQEIVPGEGAQIFFWSDYESEEELVAFEQQLCRDIESEGAALLINRDNTLPLPAGTKFTTFSQSSFNLLYGGTGSGQVSADDAITLKSALEENFGEGTVNLDMWKFLATAGYKRENAATTGGNQAQYRINEIPWEKYPDALKNTFAAYGDVALVVLARSGGEGADLPSGLAELEAYMTDGDYLRLCKEEIEMFENLQALKENGTFKKIVVLLNSSNSLQLDFVDDYGIDAVLWIGDVGMTGILGVSDILAGKVNPSGRIVDTFLKDNHSGPAMQNFGAYPWTNGSEYGVATAQNNTDAGIDKCNQDYVVYQEGIYVGYRYFDTAGKEPLFPFGYGLGFTSFELKDPSFEVTGSRIRVRADVINTGDHPGKETLQLYVSVPEGKLDQPYQMLAAFAKTGGIEPGGSCQAELSFDIADIASYSEADSAYVLEKGKYILRLGTSSRDTKVIGAVELDETVDVRHVRNVLGDSGFTDYRPDHRKGPADDDVRTVKIDSESIRCTDVIYGSSENIDISRVKDLSDDELIFLAIGSFDPDGGALSVIGNAGKSVAGAAGQTTQLLTEKGIRSYSMADGPAGIRLSREYFIRGGKVYSMALPIPETMQAFLPLPARMFIRMNTPKPRKGEEIHYQYCTAMPIGTAIAQSWNREFAEVCGDIAGTEMDMFGVDMWLAPALNIHRDIRCGRNFEYYSEDPLISGVMASCITRGVQAHQGRGTTIKHYAANNQETNRYRSNSRVSERAMREIYLKGFEICVRDSQPAAVMTSYNLLNGVHTSENRSLIEDILRDEYGFKGIVMTDWVVSMNITDRDSIYPDPQACNVVTAGGDLFMPGCKSDFDSVRKALDEGRVTRQQLMINAARINGLFSFPG